MLINSKHFLNFSALASIIGAIAIFAKTEWAVYISIIFFCTMLMVFTGQLIIILHKYVDNNKLVIESKMSFISYEFLDQNNIVYEVFKTIKCKEPILTEYDFSFKWNGSYLPKFSSDFQKVSKIIELNSTQFDKVKLKLTKPLYYNQTGVIHLKAELNNVEKDSINYLFHRINVEKDLVYFNITLRHKDNRHKKNAKIERREITGINNEYVKILEIPFDNITKSYKYKLLNPEYGYDYKISW